MAVTGGSGVRCMLSASGISDEWRHMLSTAVSVVRVDEGMLAVALVVAEVAVTAAVTTVAHLPAFPHPCAHL